MIRDEIDKIRNDFSALPDKVIVFEERIVNTKPSRESFIKDSIAELEDRQRRMGNLIFFNLDEQDTSERSPDASQPVYAGRAGSDYHHVSIISDTGLHCPNDFQTKRIGRATVGKSRPLLFLPSAELARNILRNKHKYTGQNISGSHAAPKETFTRPQDSIAGFWRRFYGNSLRYGKTYSSS